jgi:hypothetical protein
MLQARGGSLRALALRACDLMDHDPDMPLIFDLTPLAQVCSPARTRVAALPCTGVLGMVHCHPDEARQKRAIVRHLQLSQLVHPMTDTCVT